MMLQKTKSLLRLLCMGMTCVFLASSMACSAIYGGTTSDKGDQTIGEDVPSELAFDAEVGTVTYRAIDFGNTSTGNYEITNLAFVDNTCGAFSVINATDTVGNVLYKSGETLSISVGINKAVAINLRFSPATCLNDLGEKITEYTTYLVIFYNDETGAQKSRSVQLIATVTDNTDIAEACETVSRNYNDGLNGESPSRTLEPAGTYYLRIDRMRAYIQPSGAFADKAIGVGTDVNLDSIDPDNVYEAIYLPFTSDGAGNLIISTIDACAGFRLPSPITDVNLRGADSVLTTDTATTDNPESGTGTIVTSGEDIGQISFPTFKAYLEALINNSESLIQDEVTGKFAVTLEIEELTTGDTATNAYLDSLALVTDDDGEDFLPITGETGAYYLQGSALRHGAVTLVGIGRFVDENFFGSSVAHTAIVENEAYIFLMIQGIVTTAQE
jgi:hypothetical protein